jgi:hypothetical protein
MQTHLLERGKALNKYLYYAWEFGNKKKVAVH